MRGEESEVDPSRDAWETLSGEGNHCDNGDPHTTPYRERHRSQ